MPQLTRTTITLPDDLLNQLKMKSVVENSSVSKLITQMVNKNIYQKSIKKSDKNPLKLLGKLKLGTKKIYTNRDELYKEHHKRKMGA